MSAAAPSPPTELMPRFSRFVEEMRRMLVFIAERRQLLGALWKMGPLIWPLQLYLMETRRRLTALHARFAAGRLPAAPRRRAPPRPAADRRPRAGPRPPVIPPGPVLLQCGIGAFATTLRELLDDAEMRALLAASPQAGRLLRPLWRKLTTDPLPELLRPPRRPKAPHVVWQESPGADPSPRPLVCSSQPKPFARGEGEDCRPAWWAYPVALWADPAPVAEPAPSLPPWPPPLSRD